MLNIDDTYKIYQPKISTCTFCLFAKFHMFVSIKCKNGWIGEFVESVLNLALLMKHFSHWLNDNRFRLCVLNTHFNGTNFIYVPTNVHVYANVLVEAIVLLIIFVLVEFGYLVSIQLYFMRIFFFIQNSTYQIIQLQIKHKAEYLYLKFAVNR